MLSFITHCGICERYWLITDTLSDKVRLVSHNILVGYAHAYFKQPEKFSHIAELLAFWDNHFLLNSLKPTLIDSERKTEKGTFSAFPVVSKPNDGPMVYLGY